MHLAADICKMLENAEENGVIELPEGEFEGSFKINRSCTVKGKNTVLWSISGPVLTVNAERVRLEGLKIGLTGGKLPDNRNVSVFCRYKDTKFSNVEVNGAVIGIPDEENYWGLPKLLSMGNIPAEKENSFSFELYVPVNTEVKCDIYSVRLSQDYAFEGFNSISFIIDKLKSGSLIYGGISVISSVTGIVRKIVLSGSASENCDAGNANYMLFSVNREAPSEYMKMLEEYDPEAAAEETDESEQVSVPNESESRLSEINESEFNDDIREENVYLSPDMPIPIAPKKYCIELAYSSSKANLDIDGYLFMLGASGRVTDNSGMIFFGNDHSKCGSVRYINSSDKRAMVIDFAAVPPNVRRMVLLFSIYGQSPMQTFDKLVNSEISILCENGVHMHLRLDQHLRSRTILGLGFDNKDGIWELIPSGKAVGMELEDICRSYGVTII